MNLGHRAEEAQHSRGLTFVRKSWRRPDNNLKWDHDHCDACWVRIWDHPEAEAGSFGEGYASISNATSSDDHRWLCPPCFADLRGPLELKELEDAP